MGSLAPVKSCVDLCSFQEYRNLERPTIQNAGFAPIPQAITSAGPTQSSPTSIHFPINNNGALNAQLGTPSSPPNPPLPSPLPQPASAGPLVQTTTRPPTQQPPVPRNRSPSGSTTNSLTDLAHQGKKAVKGFLQDGGNRPVLNALRDNFGGPSNPAMRNVKAKREADEADKEYRKGVHWLETLRIKRATTIRSGYTVSRLSPT